MNDCISIKYSFCTIQFMVTLMIQPIQSIQNSCIPNHKTVVNTWWRDQNVITKNLNKQCKAIGSADKSATAKYYVVVFVVCTLELSL